MTRLIGSIAEISLLCSAVIIVLLLASPRLAAAFPAKILCVVWLVVAVRLLVPTSLQLPVAIRIPVPLGRAAPETPAAVSAPVSVEAGAAVSPGLPAQGPAQEPAAGGAAGDAARGGPSLINVPAAVWTAVWASGALAVAGARSAVYFLLRRRIRRCSRPLEDGAARAVYRRVLEDLRIPEGRLSALTCPGVPGPMLTGLLRPAVLLPEELVENADELALILRHELVHYKRRDIWFKLILTCATAVHWFNPLVWLMARAANAQLESACDQEVVRGGDLALRKKYCAAILTAASIELKNRAGFHAAGLSTYLGGGKKTMKKRFNGIFDRCVKRNGAPLVAGVLLTVLLLSALVGCTSAGGTSEPTGDTSPSPSASAGADADAPPSDTETAVVSSEPTDVVLDEQTVARIWADAVQARDGKGQYDLMTKALQEAVYDEFSGLNWATGTSSPWVDSYELNKTPDGVTVLYHYATSSGPAGIYEQKLTFAEEDGHNKISAFSEPVRVDGETSDSATPNPSPGPSGAPVQTSAPSPAPDPSGGVISSETPVPTVEPSAAPVPTVEPSVAPVPTPEPSAEPSADPAT